MKKAQPGTQLGTPQLGEGARRRRDKAEETTKAAMTQIEADLDAARKKTKRLKAARLAKEVAEAQAAPVAPKKPAKKTAPKKAPAKAAEAKKPAKKSAKKTTA